MDPQDDHNHESEFDGFSLDEIEKNFKSLASELKTNDGKRLDDLVDEAENEGPVEIPYFRDYNPTVLDYLQRAKTEEECQEIIEFCQKKGEIGEEEADNLKARLQKGGPRAFGQRDWGYYTSYK